MTDTFCEKVLHAARLLGINTPLTLAQIKEKYREMLKKWHPDKCGHEVETSKEMTEKIINAYEIITEYLEMYKFSFSEKEIKKNLPIDRREWWEEMYGEDPLWGKHK
ncbi:J domain-containing protein [candidate division KSB1 bacterium]|nr:J domain-containing protein [candidate division KSB1 bacterium]